MEPQASRIEAAALGAAAGDLAVHHDLVEPGPGPLRRGLLGVALGAAWAAAAVVLTRRGGRRP